MNFTHKNAEMWESTETSLIKVTVPRFLNIIKKLYCFAQ